MRSATRLQALAGTSFGRAVYAVERYMPRTTHRDRFSDKEPSPRGLASYEVNAGAAVSFSPGANYFRGRRREPEPGTTSGAIGKDVVVVVVIVPLTGWARSRRTL